MFPLFLVPTEMSVLKKENFNNWYNLKTYYAALLVTGMPLQVNYEPSLYRPSMFLELFVIPSVGTMQV